MFRVGAVLTAIYVACTALFAAGALVTYREGGWTWVSIGLAAGTVGLGLGSILESLILRIELRDDAMVVTDLKGRRRYAMIDIERIQEGKGVQPTLLLKDGKWVKLPSVGSDLGNSVRAWLRRK